MEVGIELDKLIMLDKEVGELWKKLITGIHDTSLTNGLRRNREIQLILKLVEERGKVYSASGGFHDYDHTRFACNEFGIDYQEYQACITNLQTKS